MKRSLSLQALKAYNKIPMKRHLNKNCTTSTAWRTKRETRGALLYSCMSALACKQHINGRSSLYELLSTSRKISTISTCSQLKLKSSIAGHTKKLVGRNIAMCHTSFFAAGEVQNRRRQRCVACTYLENRKLFASARALPSSDSGPNASCCYGLREFRQINAALAAVKRRCSHQPDQRLSSMVRCELPGSGIYTGGAHAIVGSSLIYIHACGIRRLSARPARGRIVSAHAGTACNQ